MRKNLLLLLFTIMLFGVWGCAVAPTTVTTSNITSPVLVGPVMKIKGDLQAMTLETKRREFDIEIENFYYFEWLVTTMSSRTRSEQGAEGTNKFDAELLKLASGESLEGIKIDNISLGSRTSGTGFWILIWTISKKNWAGIEGSFYNISSTNK